MQKTTAFSILVIYNDWLSKLFFLLIQPLHKRVAKRLIKATIKKLEAHYV